MGFLSRFSPAAASDPIGPPEWTRSPDWWQGEEPPLNIVAGESFYMDAITRLVGEPRESGWLVPLDLVLEREPKNPHDANAVGVRLGLVRKPGSQVGHLARPWAAMVAPAMDGARVRRVQIRGVVRGGWLDAPGFGICVWLDGFDPDPDILNRLGGPSARTPDTSWWARGFVTPDLPPFSAGLPPNGQYTEEMDALRMSPNWLSRWHVAMFGDDYNAGRSSDSR